MEGFLLISLAGMIAVVVSVITIAINAGRVAANSERIADVMDRWAINAKLKPPPSECSECGYDLTGNTSGVCPECGTPLARTSGVGNE